MTNVKLKNEALKRVYLPIKVNIRTLTEEIEREKRSIESDVRRGEFHRINNNKLKELMSQLEVYEKLVREIMGIDEDLEEELLQ